MSYEYDIEYENEKLREEACLKDQQIDDWRESAADAAFEIGRLIDEKDALKAEVAALRESRNGWVTLCKEAQAERDALKAEVERLRNALIDMVSIVRCDPTMDGSERPIGLVDFRRAQEALKNARTVLNGGDKNE